MVNSRQRKSLPPYVSYRTFQNFVEGLRSGIPSRIDRSFWGDMYSGSSGTQLMAALRFLGLIDKDSIPTDPLKQLVLARGSQRSNILRQIGHTAFEFILDKSFDPRVATYAQLEETFNSIYGVTGDVRRKCIKFFISLESDAGITLSPFILKRSRTLRSGNDIRRKKTTEVKVGTNKNSLTLPATDLGSRKTTWDEMVLAKFPTFNPSWPDDVKSKWFEAFNILLKEGGAALSTEER